MKFVVGKILVAGIFTIFTNIALAIEIETNELNYSGGAQILSTSNELSYLGWDAPELGTVLLLSLGLVGLILARRKSA
ncbi:MAG: hypothetical protein ACI84K_001359 [Pseudohongiellaceae bacterium]|jgi:hypothetical protein